MFVLFLMNSVMYPDMTQDIKLLHTEEMAINLEKSIGINQKFRNSVSVK